MRRTRPGTLSISDCSALEVSARTDVELAAPGGIVAQIELGAQAADAVMQGLELLADIFEMPAPDVGAQTGCHERQVVQRDGDGDAIGRCRNPQFVVRGRHLDREADDLPWRGQPLRDQ